MLFSCVHAFSQPKQALILHVKDGTQIVYFMEDRPKVTLESQEMTVTSDAGKRQLPMEDVSRWTFGMEESAVADITTDQTRIQINGETLHVIAPVKIEASIFDLNGTLLCSGHGEKLTFTPGQGVFIIKINTKTYKIAIR